MVFLSAYTQVYDSRGDCLVSAGTERGSSLQGHDGEADAEGGIPFPRPQVPGYKHMDSALPNIALYQQNLVIGVYSVCHGNG